MSGSLLLAAALGYLLGAVPVGWLVGRAAGVDVRQAGSGHTGGTNVARVTGRRGLGLLTFALDVLLAAAAVPLAPLVSSSAWAPAVAGAAAVAGHDWSVFQGFRGGVGLACLASMLMAQEPLWAAPAGAAFIAAWFPLRRLLRHDARATALALGVLAVALALVPLSPMTRASGWVGSAFCLAKVVGDWNRVYSRGEGFVEQAGITGA